MVLWLATLCFPLLLLLLLFKRLASLSLIGGRGLQDETADQLEWLRRTLPRLHAVLQDAEQRETKDEALVLWLQETKDIACDAEDVVGELEYEELRRQVEQGSRSHRGGSIGSPIPPSHKTVVFKIKEIRQRLDDVAKWRNDLGVGNVCLAHQEVSQKKLEETSSLVQETKVFGREREKEGIIKFMLASHDEVGPSVIAITGMGGLGKTTLAQLVYNDKRVEEHFDLKMWVHTTADYDVVKLTREMLVSTYRMEYVRDGANLDVYQTKLLEMLKGKRFLLVIDNLWDRDISKWRSLCAPLIYGEKGSQVLITTRDTKVARTLRTSKTCELEGLPFLDCWMLFKQHAFIDGNSGEHPRLEAMGKKIVEKFNGVPLATVAMGNLLYSELEESKWIRILESKIWEVERVEDAILPVLKLSYDHLPAQLRRCLAYCSLFPNNYKFDKFVLVQQWMAQGFVHSGGTKRMEDMATEYFDELLSRSFFQVVDKKFVIHDLIHDLTQLVSRCDHFIIDINGSHEIFGNARMPRHVSLLMTCQQQKQKSLDALCTYRGLRTLAFYFPSNMRFQIPDNLFLNLRSLRVLDLSYGGIEMLPDSIGSLRHLKYLDLSGNAFTSLPESLCHLYKLQTLKLEDCNVEELPQGISNLINLRHLQVPPHILYGVVGIGKLTNLQALDSFPVSEGHGIKIEDLENMNELRDSLSIWHLGGVRSKYEAAQAMLNSKKHLHKLELIWYVYQEHRSSMLEEEVLEALIPPAGLKDLAINGYDGVRSPSWLELRSISKLESLCLSRCRSLNSLPQQWCLPFLKIIEISYCPQLRVLPSFPITLRELTICNVGLEELPEFYLPPSLVSVSCDSASPSLSILRIDNCPVLKSLKRGLLRHHLRNLTILHIQHCKKLVHWPEGDGFQSTLASLQKELFIRDCPKLVAFPAGSTFLASLKNLTLIGCTHILNRSLFAQLQDLSAESIVHVEKGYVTLACCFVEALQHMRTVEHLEIAEETYWGSVASQNSHRVRLTCDKRHVWSWRCDDWVLAWQVRLLVRRSEMLRLEDMLVGAALPTYSVPPEDWWERRSASARRDWAVIPDVDSKHHHHNSLTLACLGDRPLPWGSSLRWLLADANLHSVFHSFNLTTLEGLWISHCRGTRPLLTDAQLSHLTLLKELQVFNCPELTLSSLQEMIQSLPSLQHLTIEACPKLSTSSLCSQYSPAATSRSNTSTLKTLFVDCSNLLCDAQFVHNHLTSLWGLHIWHSDLTSFTALTASGLRSIGQSLRHLSFWRCLKLRHLTLDLQKLLPFLKALAIGECPELQCLPEGGLPTLLEILVIHDCPMLGCRSFGHHNDWPKIAHVPVIVMNGELVQGSYREFLELREKWRDF